MTTNWSAKFDEIFVQMQASCGHFTPDELNSIINRATCMLTVAPQSRDVRAIESDQDSFESIPESIVQIGGLLKQTYGDIQPIQIIGGISNFMSVAFIMTDGNFGFILSKYLNTPSDPYYGWISKTGGLEKKKQM